MSEKHYLDQAHEYYRERQWQQRLLAARVPRSIVLRGGTLLALGGAASLSQILAACAQGGSTKDTLAVTSAEGTYKYSKYPLIEKYNWRALPWSATPYVDGTIVLTGSGSSNWDMVRQSQTSYGNIMDNLVNKRYGAGADMLKDELEGHLADRWTHAPDYSYTDYHIRRGVYFHDIEPVNGRLCTADDVKYCLDVYRTVGVANSGLDFVDRVEVLPDRETVRVYVKRPVLTLDWALASNDYWIFAREHFEGPRERWQQQPIGTGPFKMVRQRVGAEMEAVRHEGFGRTDSRWPGYQLPFMKGERRFALAAEVTTNAALRSGQIDFGTLRDYVELQDLLNTNPEFVVQVMAPNSTYTPYPWLLNLRDPLFQDIRVRRGLSMALNRRQMIDSLTGGLGAGGHTISWNFLGRADPFDPEELGPWQQYDPVRAKQMLTDAGYPNGFEMEFMVSAAPTSRDIVIQQQLAEVGVRVVFNQVESVVQTSARLNGTFKHAINNTSSTAYDPVKIASERFLPNSGKNWGGVNDPEMTALVEKATYTLDADEQFRLIKQIHERSLDQAYQLETYVAFVEFVRQPWLHNGASAVQGYFNVFGYHQAAVLWVDDKAPGDRKGRLKT